MASEWSNTPVWFRVTAGTILSLPSLNSSSYLQRCIRHALWMKTNPWNLICRGASTGAVYTPGIHFPQQGIPRERKISTVIHRGKSSSRRGSSISSSAPWFCCLFLLPCPSSLSLKSYSETMFPGLIRHLWLGFASVTVRKKESAQQLSAWDPVFRLCYQCATLSKI